MEIPLRLRTFAKETPSEIEFNPQSTTGKFESGESSRIAPVFSVISAPSPGS
jgi:hypothetical protein